MPIVVDKPQGWSPVETISALRMRDSSLANERLAYAGRLDPMAEGVMLVLAGDEVHEAEAYRALDKSYRVGVLVGFATDTYDALGLVTLVASEVPDAAALCDAFAARVGTFAQAIPPFASYRVKGRPSFYWARQGLADATVRPAPMRSIDRLEIEAVETVPAATLLASIEARVERVCGDFRQADIVARWREAIGDPRATFPLLTLRCDCSSGTFMRSLAHETLRALGSGGIALTIERLRVGPSLREPAMRVERDAPLAPR
jgi:tRNA pseudouridine55 synthase